MNNNMDKELSQMMNEKREIPNNVRQSVDQAYDLIRSKGKKKKVQYVWKRIAAVACALIVTGIVLTNEHVIAGINGFFNFGDQGVEQALNNGFSQANDSVATDKDIKITLGNYFLDKNKLGVSFQLEFEDPTVLKSMEDMSIDYRIKNGDGEYIVEFIPDTKPLKGEERYISGLDYQLSNVDESTGRAQLDVLMESHQGNIPTLEDAVVEVESVNVFYDIDKLEKIDGDWKLSVTNPEKQNVDTLVQYVMQDASSTIQVSEANANPTSLHISFKVDGTYEDESTFVDQMKVIDEDGKEYFSNGFSRVLKNNETIISTNFPFTSYNTSNYLKLMIDGIGEVDLIKQ
ncbi:DUF4179 domain-containing protein [Pseudogracilibacillus sp. SO30301A]|uniref:DUF4179 domain-containing protein n=1 Tax=Pseudogracilibacillus sp. SO30301A TaxID=3098291 RepID=UPI00300E6130